MFVCKASHTSPPLPPSNMNKILAGWSNLGCMHFPFITLNMSCHSILTCWVSAEKSAANLKGVPCRAFFLDFLLLLFCYFSLINMFLLGYILYGTLCTSWTIFFPMLVKFLTRIASDIFSGPFSSSSGTPIIQMLVHLMSSQRSLRLSHLVSFVFFLLLCFGYFHRSVFQLTVCSSASVFCYWFFLMYVSFPLLFCSSLIACSLVFLGLC